MSFSLYFCALGVFNLFAHFFSRWMFGYAGEKMTTRLRIKCFDKLLKLEMAYFDENSTGVLTTRLSNDTSKVKGTGITLKLL